MAPYNNKVNLHELDPSSSTPNNMSCHFFFQSCYAMYKALLGATLVMLRCWSLSPSVGARFCYLNGPGFVFSAEAFLLVASFGAALSAAEPHTEPVQVPHHISSK